MAGGSSGSFSTANLLLDAIHIPSAKTLLRMLESEFTSPSTVGHLSYTLRFSGSTLNSLITILSNTESSLGCDLSRANTTGASLANEVADTLAFWQINDSDKVGYFTLDNATNDDACMEDLACEHGFSPEERRIRCAAHIFNLVRAMLYGSKRENFAAIVAADSDDQDDEEQVDEAIDEALEEEIEGGLDEDFQANRPLVS
ncbi:ribonuclease H-like protein [Hirsutella rhossiliensis]